MKWHVVVVVVAPGLGLFACGEVESIDPVAETWPRADAGAEPGGNHRDAGASDGAPVTPDGTAPVDATVSPDSGEVGDASPDAADATPDAAPPPPDAAGGCDDHDLCTIDAVGPTGCTHTPRTCGAVDACHAAGACDPATGACSSPVAPDGMPCDDGIACTSPDRCISGVCNGSPALRPVAPLSTSLVTSQRPLLRWSRVSGTSTYTVEICRDPACNDVLATVPAGYGTSVRPPLPLPRGPVFWRVNADGGCGGRSVVWGLVVGPASAPRDTSILGPPDFDRDGRPDMAIGQMGASYVYYGTGTGPGLAPRQRVVGGRAVAYAGDVDGDGFGDLLTAELSSSAGILYLHRGGPASLTLALTLPGSTLLTPPTVEVAGLGDVDGDGYGDVAFSDDAYGVARLYFGGPTGPRVSQPFNLGGGIAAAANDVNGDGYADVIVGGAQGSLAFVYYGSSAGLTTPTQLDPPASAPLGFGSAVAGAGDVNGDGFADVMVATQGTSTVYVFYGSVTGVLASGAARIDLSKGGMAGVLASIGHAGDVNGDGFSDVVLGDYNGDAVQLHYGGASGIDGVPATTIAYPAGEYAVAVAGMGDADGDGFAEVIVGPAMCQGFSPIVYRGSPSGLVVAPPLASYAPPDAAGQCFGAALAH